MVSRSPGQKWKHIMTHILQRAKKKAWVCGRSKKLNGAGENFGQNRMGGVYKNAIFANPWESSGY